MSDDVDYKMHPQIEVSLFLFNTEGLFFKIFIIEDVSASHSLITNSNLNFSVNSEIFEYLGTPGTVINQKVYGKQAYYVL